jgi:hypothetical protein
MKDQLNKSLLSLKSKAQNFLVSRGYSNDIDDLVDKIGTVKSSSDPQIQTNINSLAGLYLFLNKYVGFKYYQQQCKNELLGAIDDCEHLINKYEELCSPKEEYNEEEDIVIIDHPQIKAFSERTINVYNDSITTPFLKNESKKLVEKDVQDDFIVLDFASS